jgi:hypothetical protein
MNATPEIGYPVEPPFGGQASRARRRIVHLLEEAKPAVARTAINRARAGKFDALLQLISWLSSDDRLAALRTPAISPTVHAAQERREQEELNPLYKCHCQMTAKEQGQFLEALQHVDRYFKEKRAAELEKENLEGDSGPSSTAPPMALLTDYHDKLA